MEENLKQLLLKDLCARLPYGVHILVDLDKEFDGGIIGRLVGIVPYTGKKYDIQGPLFYQDGCLTPSTIEEVRPYLRPMSSMTEEEEKIFLSLGDGVLIYNNETKTLGFRTESIDWLNAHHFDYRNLIGKGLAIAVTEENNPYKE